MIMLAASDQVFLPPPARPIMAVDGRWRSHVEQAPNCPRCASTNTKFCYYNNYSLAQPRYFCKGCRRYWTKGGSFRNLPVSRGCHKSCRSRSSRRNSESSSGSGSGSSSGKSASVEIDLGAAFAQYLKAPADDNFNQDDTQLVSQQGEKDHLLEGLDYPLGFVGDDYLESFSHGMLQDVLWSSSEDGSSLLTDFTAWEPMVHLKEMDSPPLASMSSVMGNQIQSTSMNSLMSDINWSSFDLE